MKTEIPFQLTVENVFFCQYVNLLHFVLYTTLVLMQY